LSTQLRIQQYEREGKWVYEQHPYWCTGYTFWELHSEAPDLFLHLSRSDLVYFKGDLNHRKLTYDCAAPASTPFDIAIGPMASAAGAPKVCSLRTIKSDVVVGLESDETAERLDKEEPGWKISGKYVSSLILIVLFDGIHHRFSRPSSFFPRVGQGRKFGLRRGQSSISCAVSLDHHDRFPPEDAIPFLFLVIVSCIQDMNLFYYHFSPVTPFALFHPMHHHSCRGRVSIQHVKPLCNLVMHQ